MRELSSILSGVRVIDGGLATELEHLGARIDGPLWSAHVLEDEPGKVAAVHRAYIEAGAQCIASCSYQVSRMGYAECGLPPDRADAALLNSVAIARSTAAEFPSRQVLIAGSLGPYGAALHNGAEYHGNYRCSHADLVQFHRERIEVFARAAKSQAPDLLAFETIPSIEEAHAIAEAFARWPEIPIWISFSCRDAAHVSHGEPVSECAAFAASLPQTVAVGVNCVPPSLVPHLIGRLRSASRKPILVYPNSGESWDEEHRCWTGTSDPAQFGAEAVSWFAAGADIVGGCCRTRPAHIRALTQAAAQIQ
ncbi:MAG: homocysteine S-methyltransferase [Terracidiphilus sp.]